MKRHMLKCNDFRGARTSPALRVADVTGYCCLPLFGGLGGKW